MTQNRRSLLGVALLGLAAILCWGLALHTANNLKRQYTGVSVRLFDTVISQKMLVHAMEQTNSSELSCSAAWTRSTDVVTASSQLGGHASLRLVCVYGDMRQVAPMKLLAGSAPTEDDTKGCLIDAASAWTLFHSTDAIGAKVTLDDRAFIIRGIAETYESMLMMRSDQAEYENLEFVSQKQEGAKQAIETFLYRCGVTQNNAIVQGWLFARIAWGAAWLSLWIAAALAAAVLIKRGWIARKTPARSIPLWVAALLLSALLCLGLASTAFWPQSFLPTKWSDFAFWSRLLDAWKAQAKTYALMTQLPKEIELFSALRLSLAATVAATLLGGWCVAAFRARQRGLFGRTLEQSRRATAGADDAGSDQIGL